MLAFTAYREGKDVLYLMDVASASVKRRIDLPSIDAIWSPVWSPDDKQIAFSGTHGGITDLYIMDPDGKNLRQLTKRSVRRPAARVVARWEEDRIRHRSES